MDVTLANILSGKTRDHLTPYSGPCSSSFAIHRDAEADFKRLQEAAQAAGFDLQVISSFRSFQAQEKIWNAKAQGLRPLLDTQGNILDYSQLSPLERLYAILRWSALPGASRHHWGTDLDVYDALSIPAAGYQIQLTAQESTRYFAAFHEWLDARIVGQQSFGFYRPYAEDLGGVAPEPWHLSYFPIAHGYTQALSLPFIRTTIENSTIALRELVLENSEKIFTSYIVNINSWRPDSA